ncbi:DUF2164 domain-containing protein [Methylosinus sp. R-45379]|uniref:DUF2164 domain-containing protein n=1 Tax=Methylosinus sp. R-45379 TaxID=980563 RepID=UPI000A83309E|nr:DUF2164 domain-containing protein [Methylosinus sp. R-45379]
MRARIRSTSPDVASKHNVKSSQLWTQRSIVAITPRERNFWADGAAGAAPFPRQIISTRGFARKLSELAGSCGALIDGYSAGDERTTMAIDMPKDSAKEAVLSLQRYFKENMDNEIGNLAAEGLLQFFVEEIGPIIYNKAVEDVQQRLQARIAELDVEVQEEAFGYWRKRRRR